MVLVAEGSEHSLWKSCMLTLGSRVPSSARVLGPRLESRTNLGGLWRSMEVLCRRSVASIYGYPGTPKAGPLPGVDGATLGCLQGPMQCRRRGRVEPKSQTTHVAPSSTYLRLKGVTIFGSMDSWRVRPPRFLTSSRNMFFAVSRGSSKGACGSFKWSLGWIYGRLRVDAYENYMAASMNSGSFVVGVRVRTPI